MVNAEADMIKIAILIFKECRIVIFLYINLYILIM